MRSYWIVANRTDAIILQIIMKQIAFTFSDQNREKMIHVLFIR